MSTSEEVHATAWKAAIREALGGHHPVLDYDEVELKRDDDGLPVLGDAGQVTVDDSAMPPMYILITVTRASREPLRGTGRRAVLGWRLTTLCVGTTITEVRHLRHGVRSLHDHRLPPIRAGLLQPDGESDAPVRRGTRYEALDAHLYAAPNVDPDPA